jgi:hypothetical protein
LVGVVFSGGFAFGVGLVLLIDERGVLHPGDFGLQVVLEEGFVFGLLLVEEFVEVGVGCLSEGDFGLFEVALLLEGVAFLLKFLIA